MARIRVPLNDKSLEDAESKDMALDSRYVIPKILPNHYGSYTYTFTEEPLNVTAYLMFSIDFKEFNYVPMVHILMKGPYSLFFDTDFRFLVDQTIFPTQRVYMAIERDKQRVAVYYAWPSGTPPPPTVNGTTWEFRYYIFVEGDDDSEIINVSKTI